MSYYTRQQNRRRSEATEQETLIQWCGWQQGKYPELKLIYHVPNGGSRNTLEAANLKRQGVKAGVPDLCLPVARNGFHGLYIEMKYGKNKTTENQKEWLEELTAQGYFTTVCYGAEEAERIIARYLQFPGYPAIESRAIQMIDFIEGPCRKTFVRLTGLAAQMILWAAVIVLITAEKRAQTAEAALLAGYLKNMQS